jgi:hypothetical protein
MSVTQIAWLPFVSEDQAGELLQNFKRLRVQLSLAPRCPQGVGRPKQKISLTAIR